MTRPTPTDELRAAMMLAEAAPDLLRERDALRDVLQAAIDQQKVLHEFLTKGAFAQVAELTRERDALRAEVARLQKYAGAMNSGVAAIGNRLSWDRKTRALSVELLNVLDAALHAYTSAALAGATP